MRCLVTALTLAAIATPQAIPLLTDEQIVELEGKVAAEPDNRGLQTLLGQNYAFTILGVTELAVQFNVSWVAGLDPTRARSDFAQRARTALLETRHATVAGEGGYALWQFAYEADAFRILQRLKERDVDDVSKAIGVRSLDRAVGLDPENPRWRQLRIPILIQRSNFTRVLPLTVIEAYAQVKEDVAVVPAADRYYRLADVAKLAIRAFALDDAEQCARDLIERANDSKDWNFGNALFHGNMVLGQAALRRGDLPVAAWHLVESGRTPGSPQLKSFGPNMSLARELIEAGERSTVLEFFELCGSFWKLDRGKLNQWASEVSRGVMPNFGANLLY